MAGLTGLKSAAITEACVLFIAALGCDRMDEASLRTESRLRVLSAAYLDYAAARGQGPENQGELRKHLANSLAAQITLQRLGVDDSPSLFVSERDGAPFVVRYGVPIQVMQGTRAAPIALEATGRQGTRFVAFADGRVECLDSRSLAPMLETVAATK